jgi:hypothetical protein
MYTSGFMTISGGDFTMLHYVQHLGASELERTVGFAKGRLDQGFLIVALADDELLGPDDFELGASTRFSGAVIKKDADGKGIGIGHLLQARGQDVRLLKQKVAAFLASRGDRRPAKILPNLRHTDGMIYPDAEARGPGLRSGVPQFKLLVPKKFTIIRAC